ncbi:MAG: hypothetical protein HGA66_08555 [Holophaga sp.]|nr:hypothetical protein [Holophaga sp.]
MVWALLLLSGIYAVLRYAVLGPGLGHPAPVWILNKALAVASVGCVLAALLSHGRGDGSRSRSWWGHFSALAQLHILLSLLLFAPAHYPRLFRPDGSLTLAGNLAVLGGATASLAFLNAKTRGRHGIALAAMLLLVHLAGFSSSWFMPGSWPGQMPPISLWSAAGATVALLWSLARHPADPLK